MLMRPLHKFKPIFFPLILGLITLVLSYLNFQPGTWLSGWDNLMPELNSGLNIQRTLSVAWQQYQGLGLLGGMAHAADLPRQLLIFCLLRVGVTASFIRYLGPFA